MILSYLRPHYLLHCITEYLFVYINDLDQKSLEERPNRLGSWVFACDLTDAMKVMTGKEKTEKKAY